MVNDKRKERTDATQQMEYYFGGGVQRTCTPERRVRGNVILRRSPKGGRRVLIIGGISDE